MRLIKAEKVIKSRMRICCVCEAPILAGTAMWREVWDDDGVVTEYYHLRCEGEPSREEARADLVEYLNNDPG